jgi:hypothetical protein
MTTSHFCNYLPFEEDLALYLNNLKCSLPKDDLYPKKSLIEIGKLVLEEIGKLVLEKIFFQFKHIYIYGFPYMAPPDPRGP